MIDITDFKKYKIIYLAFILSISLWIAFVTAPSYREVYVDVAVEPPEIARKTDFSWITVNEWFVTQTRVIKSDVILDQVKSDVDKDALEKMLIVGRVGAANIIRISMSSDADIEKSKRLVGQIADLYLKQLNKPEMETSGPAKKDEWITKIENGDLTRHNLNIKEELAAADKALKDHQTQLDAIKAKPSETAEIKNSIAEIDKALVSLKADLVKLQAVYTDNWPAVVKLRKQIAAQEKEKKELEASLPVEDRIEVRKAEIEKEIAKDKEKIADINKRLDETKALIAQANMGEEVSMEATAPKEIHANRIITSPRQNRKVLVNKLGRRLLVAFFAGIIIWALIGLLLKNAYLFWILKDRFFTKR
jgi:hypothetical protein